MFKQLREGTTRLEEQFSDGSGSGLTPVISSGPDEQVEESWQGILLMD